jgi:hypothetical protein
MLLKHTTGDTEIDCCGTWQIDTLGLANHELQQEVVTLRARIEREALPSPDQVRGTLTARVGELTAQNEALTRQLEVSYQAIQVRLIRVNTSQTPCLI